MIADFTVFHIHGTLFLESLMPLSLSADGWSLTDFAEVENTWEIVFILPSDNAYCYVMILHIKASAVYAICCKFRMQLTAHNGADSKACIAFARIAASRWNDASVHNMGRAKLWRIDKNAPMTNNVYSGAVMSWPRLWDSGSCRTWSSSFTSLFVTGIWRT